MNVYILKSQSHSKTYVGITNDLNRRIAEHNQGKHSYIKRYIPWEIVYFEKVQGIINARKREKYFKSSAGRKWMKENIFNTAGW